jgi:hypothetical protein
LRQLAKLRERLRIGLARDWTLEPGGKRPGGSAQQLLVIAPRTMPTLDYYLSDVLSEEAGGRHRVVYDAELERGPSGDVTLRDIAPGTRVVLVRMPASAWAQLIASAAERVVEVVWLIDDDIAAAREDRWLPADYKRRLLADYLRFKRAFEGSIDRVWASTPVIAARFPASRVEVRPPRPLKLAQEPWVTIFYHGTAAHRREHEFLRPIFQQVQALTQRTVIEVAGDHAIYRMFRDVPRLRVVHPMRWPDYLAYLASARYQIGLAPLLDTPFNRGRSGVKALEIAAMGAQGVLSRRAPYTDYANLPGMHLVGDAPSEWVEQIVTIARQLAV